MGPPTVFGFITVSGAIIAADVLISGSSLKGVNRGVDGMPPPSGMSWNGITALVLVGVFGSASFCLDMGTGGGAITPFASMSGPGSLKGTIFAATAPEFDPDAIRRVRPACFKVLPATLLTSGIFSFTRDLRVPISGYGVTESVASADSAPEGSTKIWRRAFVPSRGPGRDPWTSVCDDDEGAREIDANKGAASEDEEVTPNAVLRLGAFGAGCGGIEAAVIIRF